MTRHDKTLQHVVLGRADANIAFADLRALLLALGFAERIRGDHHIFTRDGVDEIMNLQPLGAKAQAYQVRQVRGVILKYKLELSMHLKYEVIIYWSAEDQAFVAEAPELPGCMADGKTHGEALSNLEIVMAEWIETASEMGRAIPKPSGRLMFA